jgi:hypothetical protein
MDRFFLLRLAATAALAAPAVVHAAPPQRFAPIKNATGTTNIVLPATISKLNDMDFGALTVTTAGTAIIDSTTGAVTTTGGVLFAGGSPHAAEFAAVSPSRTVVRVQLPNKGTTLTRVGGTETMTLDTWTMNGAATRNVAAHETFAFKVGGTLHVATNQVEGTYAGTFNVTINYN